MGRVKEMWKRINGECSLEEGTRKGGVFRNGIVELHAY